MAGVRDTMVRGRGSWWVLGCALLWMVGVPVPRAWAQGMDAPSQERPVAFTDPGDLPRLRLVDGAQELPLKHTDVRATITGLIAEVEVEQTYRNDRDEPIEAIYTFPLPENSGVRDMEIVIGDRTIKAEVKKRAEARRTYEQARARGNTAALLEQERTNIFTQSVANIAPKEDIRVVIRYVQDISYDAGQYEFVFPMVVGPRYTAGSPDAQRITPSVAGKGTRTGHDITLEVTVDAGMPIRGVTVPTHDTQTRQQGARTTVTLAERASVPNRDFVLRYRADGPELQSTLFIAEHGDDRYFTLLMQPPTADVDALVGSRELIFVVDISGSMHGTPLASCKSAMRRSLRLLRPQDTFNVITFAGGTGQAFDRPVPANQENTAAAESFVDGLRAGGGTEILNAVDAALQPPVGQGRHRYVFFLTDGFVSIEDSVYARTRKWVSSLAKDGQRARVFALGTGSSPNRELLDKLTKAGQGAVVYAANREDPARAVDTFHRYIDHAVFTSPKIEWGSATVSDTHPGTLPDLYVSRPGVVHGRLRGSPPSSLRITGTRAGRSVAVPVRVQRLDAAASAVQAQLWARSEIEELQLSAAWDGDTREAEITNLGLEHHLATRYTSFVAVDTSRVVGQGQPQQVEQPIDAAEGVDMTMAGAVDYDEAPPSYRPESEPESIDMELDAGRAGCAHCSATGEEMPGAVVWLGLLLLGGFRRRRRSSC